MSRSRRPVRSRKGAQKKKGNPLKSAFYIVLLAGAVSYLGWYFLTEFSFRTDYNHTVDELDSAFQAGEGQQIVKCAEKLEKLYYANKDKADRARPIKVHLIKCYRHLAADAQNSLKVQAEYLSKIVKIQADGLTASEQKIYELAK